MNKQVSEFPHSGCPNPILELADTPRSLCLLPTTRNGPLSTNIRNILLLQPSLYQFQFRCQGRQRHRKNRVPKPTPHCLRRHRTDLGSSSARHQRRNGRIPQYRSHTSNPKNSRNGKKCAFAFPEDIRLYVGPNGTSDPSLSLMIQLLCRRERHANPASQKTRLVRLSRNKRGHDWKMPSLEGSGSLASL